jgi:uncharacterized protein
MILNDKLRALFKRYESHPQFLGVEINDVNQPGAMDDRLLGMAARQGNLEDIETLVEAGARVNEHGEFGNTALHEAAMFGQAKAVLKLLELGADPALTNEFHQTPLEMAEMRDHHPVADLIRGHKKKV